MDETARKVLIIDDEDDSREFVMDVLRSEKLDFICAGDGEEGYRRIIGDRPSLVILDVHMPKINGFDLFHRMKKVECAEHIPVIMLTGVHQKIGIKFSGEDMRDFMDAEPEAYLEKPLDPVKLRETTESLLRITL